MCGSLLKILTFAIGVIAKIELRDLDLLLEGQRFESSHSHSSECSYKYDEREYCCAQSSSLARHKLTHSSAHSM